jgi:hypothetical protein
MKKYIYSPQHQGAVEAPKNSWWLKDTPEIKAYMEECKFLYDNPEKHTMPTHRLQAKEWQAYNSWLSSPPAYKVREEDIKDFLEPIDESQIDVRDCETCGGDGKETCTNPDHNFIDAMSFQDIGRIGCPVCGHDPKYKVPNGGNCEDCNGTGKVAIPKQKGSQTGNAIEAFLKERWPDTERLKMIEGSVMGNEQVYQYGYYDGYQSLRKVLLSLLTGKE